MSDLTSADQVMIQRMLSKSAAPLTVDNSIAVFCQGDDKLLRLLQDIRGAKRSIYLQYFIIRNDPTSKILLHSLEQQAAAGLDVRVLCDGLGSLRLPDNFFRRLRKAGGLAATYAPPWRFLHRLNYRNHRKICVLDESIGYVGGFNLGDEYAGRPEKFSEWRDLHLRIEGSAVDSLLAWFRHDWQTAMGQPMLGSTMRETVHGGNVSIQIVASGPETPWQPVKAGMLKMITSATEHIYLETPYFIPDASLLEALRMAALSGVVVKVIIPGQPDHPFVLPAGLSFIGDLLPAGVQFYLYQSGFLHSKMLTVDGAISTVGSANFDLRSFRLDYEVNAFIYDQRIASELEQVFRADLARSRELTLDEYNRRSSWQRAKSAFARRLAPLL